MMERNKEYDAFGQWIFEIDGEHEVPRLFKEYYDENESYQILFKVPRRIDRVKASPNMDLYDYLIGARDTYLHILKREGKGVTETKINYSDIFAVKDTHALLKGELILFTENETEKILYSTVSEEIIMRLINIIERNACKSVRRLYIEGIPVEYIPGDPGSVDFLFVNLFDKLKEFNPEIKLVVHQPNMTIKKTAELKQKLKYTGYMLSRSAFIMNDKDLIIIERPASKFRKVKEGMDYSYFYIPYQSINAVRINKFDEAQNLDIVEFNAGNQTFGFIIGGGNENLTNLYHVID